MSNGVNLNSILAALIAKYDKNHDDQIASIERSRGGMEMTAEEFSAADTSRDGLLSQDEILNWLALDGNNYVNGTYTVPENNGTQGANNNDNNNNNNNNNNGNNNGNNNNQINNNNQAQNQTVNFADYDKNNDGKISELEKNRYGLVGSLNEFLQYAGSDGMMDTEEFTAYITHANLTPNIAGGGNNNNGGGGAVTPQVSSDMTRLDVDINSLSVNSNELEQIPTESWYYRVSDDSLNDYPAAVRELYTNSVNVAVRNELLVVFENNLRAQGIDLNNSQIIARIENIFYNAYNNAFAEVIADMHTDGTWDDVNNLKTFNQNIVQNFNNMIQTIINFINQEETDFDILDIALVHGNNDMYQVSLYSDISYADINNRFDAEHQTSVNVILEGLKPQLAAKASSWCQANGYNYDANLFETRFNSYLENYYADTGLKLTSIEFDFIAGFVNDYTSIAEYTNLTNEERFSRLQGNDFVVDINQLSLNGINPTFEPQSNEYHEVAKSLYENNSVVDLKLQLLQNYLNVFENKLIELDENSEEYQRLINLFDNAYDTAFASAFEHYGDGDAWLSNIPLPDFCEYLVNEYNTAIQTVFDEVTLQDDDIDLANIRYTYADNDTLQTSLYSIGASFSYINSKLDVPYTLSTLKSELLGALRPQLEARIMELESENFDIDNFNTKFNNILNAFVPDTGMNLRNIEKAFLEFFKESYLAQGITTNDSNFNNIDASDFAVDINDLTLPSFDWENVLDWEDLGPGAFYSLYGVDVMINNNFVQYRNLSETVLTIYNNTYVQSVKEHLFNNFKTILEDNDIDTSEQSDFYTKMTNVFENMYNQVFSDTYTSAEAQILIDEFCASLVNNWNNYVTSGNSIIDEINASDEDIDILDVNYAALSDAWLGSVYNGQSLAIFIPNVNNGLIRREIFYHLYHEFETKAQAYCLQKGIEYNSAVLDMVYDDVVDNFNINLYTNVVDIQKNFLVALRAAYLQAIKTPEQKFNELTLADFAEINNIDTQLTGWDTLVDFTTATGIDLTVNASYDNYISFIFTSFHQQFVETINSKIENYDPDSMTFNLWNKGAARAINYFREQTLLNPAVNYTQKDFVDKVLEYLMAGEDVNDYENSGELYKFLNDFDAEEDFFNPIRISNAYLIGSQPGWGSLFDDRLTVEYMQTNYIYYLNKDNIRYATIAGLREAAKSYCNSLGVTYNATTFNQVMNNVYSGYTIDNSKTVGQIIDDFIMTFERAYKALFTTDTEKLAALGNSETYSISYNDDIVTNPNLQQLLLLESNFTNSHSVIDFATEADTIYNTLEPLKEALKQSWYDFIDANYINRNVDSEVYYDIEAIFENAYNAAITNAYNHIHVYGGHFTYANFCNVITDHLQNNINNYLDVNEQEIELRPFDTQVILMETIYNPQYNRYYPDNENSSLAASIAFDESLNYFQYGNIDIKNDVISQLKNYLDLKAQQYCSNHGLTYSNEVFEECYNEVFTNFVADTSKSLKTLEYDFIDNFIGAFLAVMTVGE